MRTILLQLYFRQMKIKSSGQRAVIHSVFHLPVNGELCNLDLNAYQKATLYLESAEEGVIKNKKKARSLIRK